MSDLMSLLFETKAFKICQENNPFWYTSGKIGPYFVNADFLYGSEDDSKKLLDFIDNQLISEDKVNIPANIFEKVLEQYESNDTFKFVIDALVEYIRKNIDINSIDYISGGERRDWLFSTIVAYQLGKPHVTIYKDLFTVASTCDFEESNEVTSIINKNFLHIADLLNQASSYEKAWLPAISNLGSTIVWSVVVVDRFEGGTEVLEKLGVNSFSLLQISNELFNKALELNIINEAQLQMLRDFQKDPDSSMRLFLLTHPEFIENSLKSDNPKTVKRANECIEKNIYNLD